MTRTTTFFATLALYIFSINTFAAKIPPRSGVPPVLLINATNESFIPAIFAVNYNDQQGKADYYCLFEYFPPNYNFRFSIDSCKYEKGKWPDNYTTPHKITISVINHDMSRGISGDIHYDPKTHHWGELNNRYGVLNIKYLGANSYVITY